VAASLGRDRGKRGAVPHPGGEGGGILALKVEGPRHALVARLRPNGGKKKKKKKKKNTLQLKRTSRAQQ